MYSGNMPFGVCRVQGSVWDTGPQTWPGLCCPFQVSCEMITMHCRLNYWFFFFSCIVRAQKKRTEGPPGRRDTKVRESFLEEVVPELSMKGWISALPGGVWPMRGGVLSRSQDLEVRWSCNGETKAILRNRKYLVEKWPGKMRSDHLVCHSK